MGTYIRPTIKALSTAVLNLSLAEKEFLVGLTQKRHSYKNQVMDKDCVSQKNYTHVVFPGFEKLGHAAEISKSCSHIAYSSTTMAQEHTECRTDLMLGLSHWDSSWINRLRVL